MFRRLLVRCTALAVVVTIPFALAVSSPAAAGDVNPCTLVPGSLVTALTSAPATGELDGSKAVGTDDQETCHYPGEPGKTLLVTYHDDPAQFDAIKARPQVRTLSGLDAEALWWSKPGVICVLEHGRYVSMNFSGDEKKAAPSPAFLAAAKAAASKL